MHADDESITKQHENHCRDCNNLKSCLIHSTIGNSSVAVRSRPETSASNSGNASRDSVVTFGDVQVREYERSLGDWWDVEYGLSLGWDYTEIPATPLPPDEDDANESVAKFKKNAKKAKAKVKAWFLVNRNRRNSLGTIDPKDLEEIVQISDKARVRSRSKKKDWIKEKEKQVAAKRPFFLSRRQCEAARDALCLWCARAPTITSYLSTCGHPRHLHFCPM